MWDLDSGELKSCFNGHRSAISALNYNSSGTLIASGSQDTEIIVWDIVGNHGLFRL